jgi:glutathionyl-hydroquinone reductase
MKLMIGGTWRGDIDPTPELDAQRTIHAGCFRDRITADGSSVFRAEGGRYHLYASPACPFSHRVIIVRALKRLTGLIGLSVLHPLWDTQDGWTFADNALATIDGAGSITYTRPIARHLPPTRERSPSPCCGIGALAVSSTTSRSRSRTC